MPADRARDLREVCEAIALALSYDAVFTHVTSAQLRGWPLPSAVQDWPVIACTSDSAPHHDRRGVYVRRCAIPSEHRHTLEGLQVASAEWTANELAEDLSLIDLVVALDGALNARDCTAESLLDGLVPGRRGVRRLRRAIALADGRSESPWETVLRLVHVLSGVTDVEPQAPIHDEAGAIAARADLRLGRTRRIAEYDGGVHRAKEQHARDLAREKRLARLAIERYGYTATEIHRDVHQIVRDAEAALGLERDPRRAEGWLDEYATSSLASHGRAVLGRRMQRFQRDVSPRSIREVA